MRVDVLVAGGGPAGLSAALMLGRCCRRVLLCDAGRPRNQSRHMHCFLSRDGADPAELRRWGREELARYETVEVRDVAVTDVQRLGRAEPSGTLAVGDGFLVALADGTVVRARKLLLATGLVDELPPLPGLADLWARSAFPCPYCDGWEYRGRRIGVLAHGEGAVSMCRVLSGWSRNLVLYSHVPEQTTAEQQRYLVAGGVRLVRHPVAAVAGAQDGAGPVRLHLTDGSHEERDVLFVSNPQRQRSPLIERLGCHLNEKGRVATGNHESTNVPGLFVAGDASENVQFAIVAAAEGTEAGFEINRSLAREDFLRPAYEPQSSRTVQTSRLAT
jgi:thioredoxin reductase